MISLKEYIEFGVLNEKFINWFPEQDKDKKFETEYSDALRNMIDISYQGIGGYMHGDYDIQELIADSSLIKIYKSNKKPVAFRIYKDKLGRKAFCSGTDGSENGKIGLYMIFKEDAKYMRAWSEVNEKLEHINVTKFGAERVPNIYVNVLLNKEVQLLPDGYHYKRNIGGVMSTKCIITGSTEDLIKRLKEINKDQN